MAIDEYPITIVGCGPGSPKYVTPAVFSVVDEADLLIGTERLLRLFPLAAAKRVVVNSSVEGALDEIEKQLDHGTVAVLVTGDPGIFSLAKLVIERFGRERCRVIPGISSVQIAFARLGLDWVDVRIVSAHKQDPEPDPTLLTSDKIAVLLGREGSLRWVAELIRKSAPADRRIFLCENLTLDDELVREVQPEDLAKLDVSSRTVVLIVKSDLLV